MQPILLTNWRAPGDTVCMTACVRDLFTAWPGRYKVYIGGSCGEIWENNPYIAGFVGTRFPRDIPHYWLSYLPQLRASSTVQLHFLTAFHRTLEAHLGHPVPLLRPKGDLHLDREEREHRPVRGRYWVLVAGGKENIETKVWSAARFQQVVDLLRARGIRIVQIGAKHARHRHPKLERVQSLVGRTSLRDVLKLIWHSEGVICPVTFTMHVAAAFDKPCVVLAGGREPWWWEAYIASDVRHFGPHCQPVSVPHEYLHSQGQLDCCRHSGCWKTKLPDASSDPTEACVLPVDDGHGSTIPACLELITAETVVDAVSHYYLTGTAPEIHETPPDCPTWT